jgi:DNA polymerase III subunit gamma/tau
MSDLAISMRPRSFDDMIGVSKLTAQIQDQINSHKSKRAWLFSGQTGSGKTTIARIMAIGFQCRHVAFGEYCRKCYKERYSFDINEIYASKHTGIDAIRDLLSGYMYEPKPGSLIKAYILNEVHRLSTNAQDLLLEFTEDCPRKTRFILTTTEPEKLLRTLRGRCEVCDIPPFDLKDIRRLVKRIIRKNKSEKSSTDLAEKLMEKKVTSARLIVNAVQKYITTDSSADEASNVELGSDIDTLALCNCIVKGSWEDVAKYMQDAEKEDMAVVKASVQGYLRSIILGDSDFSKRTDVVADGILKLHMVRDEVPAVSAVLYKLCKSFSDYKR